MLNKHENDENWREVILKNICTNVNSTEYKAEYFVRNAYPREYVSQIQWKCEIGMSEFIRKTFVSRKEAEVVSVILFFMILLWSSWNLLYLQCRFSKVLFSAFIFKCYFSANLIYFGNVYCTYLETSDTERPIRKEMHI